MPQTTLDTGLERLGLDLPAAARQKLLDYVALIAKWNQVHNLTAIREPVKMVTHHLLDSLALLKVIDGPAKRVVDIGTGAGLPGIPLAIARPDIRFTLLEATGKKARFLESVAGVLGLRNVTVLHERAERAARGPLRETFDVATSRAVGGLGDLALISVPLLRIGGIMLAIKGERAGEEIAAAKQVLYELHASVAAEMRGETNTIVAVEKNRKTPAKFP